MASEEPVNAKSHRPAPVLRFSFTITCSREPWTTPAPGQNQAPSVEGSTSERGVPPLVATIVSSPADDWTTIELRTKGDD